MICPECGEWAAHKSATRNTRDADGWSVIRRERVCPNGHRFATFECYEYADVEVIFKARDLLCTLSDTIQGGDMQGAIVLLQQARADF
jgi:transcriptional regulator NrdR family protein